MSLILVSSCSDPSNVGLQLAPENNQIGVFFQEFELDAQVVLLDSFNTTNQGLLVVGNETDPYFGKTISTGYSRLFIEQFAERPRSDASLDSMYFFLDVVSVNGQDLDQPKLFSVHRLTEPLRDTLYFNFDELTYEASPLASAEVTFNDTKDTTLRLPVTEEFAQEIFNKMRRGEEFDDLFSFRDYLPGVAVNVAEGSEVTAGVNVGFGTGFQVYYSYVNDTVSTEYSINTASSRSFNGVKSDRTGTPTAVVQQPSIAYETGSKVGMKANLGMVIKIDTSPFDAFLDTLQGITFNQINFELGEIDEVPEGQNPLASMIMYMTNETNSILTRESDGQPLSVQQDGQPQIAFDEEGNEQPSIIAPAVLSYNQVEKKYVVQITSYTNAVYRKQLMRKDWLLYGDTPGAGGDAFKRSLRQFVLDKSKIKVRVIYSQRN
ncbi:DUF4270 family protein [Algoriphagus namhaensis]